MRGACAGRAGGGACTPGPLGGGAAVAWVWLWPRAPSRDLLPRRRHTRQAPLPWPCAGPPQAAEPRARRAGGGGGGPRGGGGTCGPAPPPNPRAGGAAGAPGAPETLGSGARGGQRLGAARRCTAVKGTEHPRAPRQAEERRPGLCCPGCAGRPKDEGPPRGLGGRGAPGGASTPAATGEKRDSRDWSHSNSQCLRADDSFEQSWLLST
ncbi:hypothetical protein VULLAG_LOCUS15055 [Vulpes lagopus]